MAGPLRAMARATQRRVGGRRHHYRILGGEGKEEPIRVPLPADRWLVLLLAVSTLLQASTAITRPMGSYRALEIGMGPELLGVVAAAYALAPLLFALTIGRQVDSRGERRFIFLGAFAMLAASLALAATSAVVPLLLLLALSGVAHLVAIIAIQTTLATRSRAEAYDRRFGHLAFVASLGQLIGPAMGGWVAGEGSPEGTSRALILAAALALVAAVILLRVRPPAPFAVAEPVSSATATSAPPAGKVDRTVTGSRPSLLSVLRMPGMTAAILASTTVLSAIDVLVVYLPALGEERGLAASTVGALLAVRAGASMVSRLALGRATARLGRERVLVGSMAIAAVGIVALPFGPLPLMVAAMAVAGLGLGVGQPLTMSWVAARAAPGTRATAFSIRIMGNRLGQVIVPLVAGTFAVVAGPAGVLAVTGVTVGVSTLVVRGQATGEDRGESLAPRGTGVR
jgi:MFS family permease